MCKNQFLGYKSNLSALSLNIFSKNSKSISFSFKANLIIFRSSMSEIKILFFVKKLLRILTADSMFRILFSVWFPRVFLFLAINFMTLSSTSCNCCSLLPLAIFLKLYIHSWKSKTPSFLLSIYSNKQWNKPSFT